MPNNSNSSQNSQFKIQCDRHIAPDLLREIDKNADSSWYIEDKQKNFDGAIDSLVIVANLTTIAANALMIWIATREDMKVGTKILGNEKSEKK